MRACLDTSLLVSYVLAHGRPGVPIPVVDHLFAGTFDAVVGETTMAELRASIQSKPWLGQRIAPARVDAFVAALRAREVVESEPSQPIPNVSRDFADDYLLALSTARQVDFLVSGDKNLLVLEELAGVRIIGPAAFVAILDQQAGRS